MDTPQEQQPVRRQLGNEESGWPIRDNIDVDGAVWCGVQAAKKMFV